MSTKPIGDEELPTEVQLMRIITLSQAAELAGVSLQTVRRSHADKIIRISPRRVGIRLRDALLIAGKNVAP